MIQLDVLDHALREHPDRIALRFGNTAFSYRELEQRARRLASRLQEQGLQKGDRVAVLAANHPVHFDLLIAAAKLGVIALPLNTRLAVPELKAQLAFAAPALLLIDDDHEASGLIARLIPGLPSVSLSCYETWLAGASDEAIRPALALTGDDLHLILFTGGSTGTPKAVCLPYRQTLGNADDTVAAWGLRTDDCAIQCTPCFHAAANVLSLPLLRVGGSVVLMPRFEAGEYLRLLAQHRATLMFMVPSMYQTLLAHPAFATVNRSSVRLAISGGAPCPPPLRAAFAARGISFRSGFGMTEAGVNCFRITDEELARQPDSVGRPMPNIEVRIQREDGSEAAVNEVGELCLAGPQICAGYLEKSLGQNLKRGWPAQDFRDGWLFTGDLACRDAEGLYTIRGRRKDMYISGGENVYPAEVEAALALCPGVAECCVFGWPDARWGECGVALVVTDNTLSKPGLTAFALRETLRSCLAGYKLPADIRVVEALPRSAAGKLLRAEAKARYTGLLAAETQAAALEAIA